MRLKWWGGATCLGQRIVIASLLGAIALWNSPALGQEKAPEAAAPAAETPAAPAETPAAAPSEETPADAPAKDSSWLHGSFQTEFDGAWSDDDRDLNMDQTLELNVDFPNNDKMRVRSMFWVWEDFDSESDSLRSLNDNYDSDIQGRPLHLYLEIDDLWGESTLRVGRQRILEGAAFNRIDGVYFKKQTERGVDWYVFGGMRASLHEEDFNDPVFGGGVAFQMTPKTRVAIDGYWVNEDRNHSREWRIPRLSYYLYRDYPRDDYDSFEDGVLSLSLWQQITTNWRLFSRLDLNNGAGDEITMRVTGYVPAWDVTVEATYRRLFDEIEDRANDLTSYYRILGPQEEYDDFLLALYKPITKRITLSVEGQIHNVDSNFPTTFLTRWSKDYDYAYRTNLDYTRASATLTVAQLVWGIDTSFTAEVWDVETRDSSWSVGAEFEKKWDTLTLTFAAEYLRYEGQYSAYDFFPNWQNEARRVFSSLFPGSSSTFYVDNNFLVNLKDVKPVNTNEDVFSLSLEGKWAFRKNQEVNLGLTFEDDDTADSPLWRVQAGYALRF
ncbi:MAG: hypothetical protein K1Y02_19070 [Candidatus Hydrogenedentes bacterium]|nr:hypothetical protein [Candidatus Hydrogenedentota bacterium]